MATNKTAPEATPNCVGDRNEVGTAHRPLNVAIGVATKEIRDMHRETLAKIPQDGEVGLITQCIDIDIYTKSLACDTVHPPEHV